MKKTILYAFVSMLAFACGQEKTATTDSSSSANTPTIGAGTRGESGQIESKRSLQSSYSANDILEIAASVAPKEYIETSKKIVANKEKAKALEAKMNAGNSGAITSARGSSDLTDVLARQAQLEDTYVTLIKSISDIDDHYAEKSITLTELRKQKNDIMLQLEQIKSMTEKMPAFFEALDNGQPIKQ
jgi:hypothetical protein